MSNERQTGLLEMSISFIANRGRLKEWNKAIECFTTRRALPMALPYE